jgi:saccharopine dehydrogenase-like NADP-dependent oxidoreductase
MYVILEYVFLIICAIICFAESKYKVLVVGGSGRVGGSAVRALIKRFPEYSVGVGGRSVKTWEVCQSRLSLRNDIVFVPMDVNDESSLENIISTYDLIVHTAGPFQGVRENKLLKQALISGKKYIDVCDDIPLSAICRSAEYQEMAKKYKGSAVISTGIWPGGSSLLAQEVIDKVGGTDNVKNVTFSFFTAGSGGAGPTILTATFLILGEDVITYVNNKRILKKSATDKRIVDFGKGIGNREVVRLSLIECESCHESGVESVETFFGTAPPLWNTLFALMA